MKPLRRIFFLLVVLVAAWIAGESLLQPRVRVVSLEGVPFTTPAPDVTFMLGANMDPPVMTNPFLVVFSPVEKVTGRTRILPGNLHVVSDSAAVFVWDAFGIRTIWHLDRHSLELRPLFVQPPNTPAHFCTKLFPTTASLARSQRGLEIQKSPDTGCVSVKSTDVWSEALIPVPGDSAFWPLHGAGA